MRVATIIQARISSTRFPGKVLADLNGKPMLGFQLERLSRAKLVGQMMVATSSDPSDVPIAEFCKQYGILCHQGSLDDVLDRYYQAAKKANAEVIVRLTGDCPLMDPIVVDLMIEKFLTGHFDYLANTAPPEGSTYPDGMDVEIFSMNALEKAWQEAQKPSEREHVTFYFWKNPDHFRIGRVDLPQMLSHYRLTVDYPEDLIVVRKIVEALYPKNPAFTMQNILNWLDEHGDIRKQNANFERNQGWASAFLKDHQEKEQV